MITTKDAIRIVKQKISSDEKIEFAFEMPKAFIFSVIPKNADGPVMDPFYSVDKKTGAYKEFPYLLDLENFNKYRVSSVFYDNR